jgi:hypothetical protein
MLQNRNITAEPSMPQFFFLHVYRYLCAPFFSSANSDQANFRQYMLSSKEVDESLNGNLISSFYLALGCSAMCA